MSAPPRSGTAQQGQDLVVDQAVRAQAAAAGWGRLAGEIAEPAAGLLDDDLERGDVPDGRLRLQSRIGSALGDQQVDPEVAVPNRPPTGHREVEERLTIATADPALDAAVQDVGIGEASHL